MNHEDIIKCVRNLIVSYLATDVSSHDLGIKLHNKSGYDLSFHVYKIMNEIDVPAFIHFINEQKSHWLEKVTHHKSVIVIKLNRSTMANIVTHYFTGDAVTTIIKEKYLVEFSSPNTNKPMHLGHVRNNCLGMAVSNLLTSYGHDVHKVALINDRGVHICKSMLMYKNMGKDELPTKKGDEYVGDFYCQFEKALTDEYDAWQNNQISKTEYIRTHSILTQQINDMLEAWEDGDPETLALWNKMNSWVIKGFCETYEKYGVTFHSTEKESEIYQFGKEVVRKAFEEGKVQRAMDGSYECDLVEIGVVCPGTEEHKTKKLLRANGTSMYITQDIGTIMSRFERFNFDKMIYVVGNEQDRHFEILFKLSGHINPFIRGKCKHLSYGMVELPDGKMKSRLGNTVEADKLLSDVSAIHYEQVKNKWFALDQNEIKQRSDIIALAAIKFYMLMFCPSSTVKFDIKKSLSHEGKTGPYILYQYARVKTILAKLEINKITDEFTFLYLAASDGENDILKQLYWFGQLLDFAVKTLDPSKVLDAVYNVASAFSKFYAVDSNSVIKCNDANVKKMRIGLIWLVQIAIKRGMDICSIQLLDQM